MEALEALLGKATSPAIPGLEAEVLEPQRKGYSVHRLVPYPSSAPGLSLPLPL